MVRTAPASHHLVPECGPKLREHLVPHLEQLVLLDGLGHVEHEVDAEGIAVPVHGRGLCLADPSPPQPVVPAAVVDGDGSDEDDRP